MMMNPQHNQKIAAPKWVPKNDEITYFITLCTQNKTPYFGDVIASKMHLSPVGELAQNLWIELPEHFDALRLENFVIMPDHMHAIFIIDRKNQHNVEHIINAYKSALARYAQKFNYPMQWQNGFYKHIIKEQKVYENIAAYIEDNPRNWKKLRA